MRVILDFLEFQLYKGKWIAIFLFCFAAILFHSLIEHWISTHLVARFLTHVTTNKLSDFLFIAVGLIIFLIATNRALRNYHVGEFNIVLYIIVFVGYIYYRNFRQIWDFTSFSVIRAFYLDIVFLPFGLGIIIFLRNHLFSKKIISQIKSWLVANKPQKFITPLILDEPLKANQPDELARRQDAIDLSKKLLVTESEKSIAIGINGEWGSGKSSFFQMMKDELKNHPASVIIDFNPWRGYKKNALYDDFFASLSEVVSKHSDLVKNDLKRYGETLTSSKQSTVAAFVSLSSNLFGVESVEEQHKEINAALKKIGLNIFVFIDDLDRLSDVEISELIKLVRNTADFNGLKFVLAYDRNYLTNAIKALNGYNYAVYLDKIILYEYTLTPIAVGNMEDVLRSLFDKYVVPEARGEIEKITRVGNFDRGTQIFHFLVNLRDVKRFANRLLPAYNQRYKEVEVVDFVNLEILRFRFPSLIKLLYYRKQDFIQITDNGTHNLTTVGQSKDEYVLFNYINDNLNYLQIENANKERLQKLLIGLFIVDRIFDSSIPDKSIKRAKNFDAYFRESDSEGSISHRIFEETLANDFPTIKRSLQKFIKEKKRKSLVDRFTNYDVLKRSSTKDEFEKLIRSIFYLGNIPAVEGEEFYGYPDRDIYNKLYDQNAIANKFYGGQKEYLQSFLLNVLDSAEMPFFNEAGFLSFLSDNNFAKDFIVNQTQIEFYLIKYFQNYCENQTTLERPFWQLYHFCIKREAVDANSTMRIPMDAAKEIQVKFAFKNATILKKYLENHIEKQPFEENGFAISQAIGIVYGSFPQFEERLRTSSFGSLDFVQEFGDFYKVFESTDFKKYVNFDFKYLEVTQAK